MITVKDSQVVRSNKGWRTSSVLVVDDEPFVRKILMRTVERAGFHVTGAENGQKAVDILKISPYDIVISDIVMSEMDGMELLAWIRMEYPETFVLLITGNREKYSADRVIKAGADHFITKPFHNVDITRTLEAVHAAIVERKGKQESMAEDEPSRKE